ncbi:unnamed protein product [Bursaphelenchus xylophilus]|uniref:(pine wood nematode) hypothetical protein n=1 Tax=Bursaphelenchus xylophilus TaxID=6326 RepID=A0A1I7SAT7_BURXY|nr:unnamed protein product [Bursaphelenchus xylophilus]CAG9126783.1 unnamed protein product [Bursaphelenchus xylophilus]
MDVSIAVPCWLFLMTALFGIFGNSNIIWASFRSRQLRSACSIFIAVNALADIAHQCGHFVLAYFLVMEDGQATNFVCYLAQAIPLYGCTMGSLMLLFISTDRLLRMATTTAYNRICNKYYIAIVITVTCVTPLIIAWEGYTVMMTMPDNMIICAVPHGYVGRASTDFLRFNSFLNITTLVIYAVVYAVAKRRKFKDPRKILRSITTVTICVVCGWMLTMTVGVAFMIVLGNENVPVMVPLYVGLFVNISMGMSYVIFFAMNRNYRNAFIEQLQILSCGECKGLAKIRPEVAYTCSHDYCRKKVNK